MLVCRCSKTASGCLVLKTGIEMEYRERGLWLVLERGVRMLLRSQCNLEGTWNCL